MSQNIFSATELQTYANVQIAAASVAWATCSPRFLMNFQAA